MSGVSHQILSSLGVGSTNGNDSYTKILLHMDGANAGTTFTDTNLGGSAHTWTATTATTSTTQIKFGTTSLSTGAAAGKILTPDSADFTLGSGDFTADCWFYRSGGDGTLRMIAGQGDSSLTPSNSTFDLSLSGTNHVSFEVFDGVTSTIINGTTAITAVGWHHIAGVRTGNTILVFLDGVQEATSAFSGTVPNSTASLAIGAVGDAPTGLWNGFIDEFRLSVGLARWTSNFTPPTVAYS